MIIKFSKINLKSNIISIHFNLALLQDFYIKSSSILPAVLLILNY